MIGRANVHHYRLRTKYNPEPTHVFVYEDHRYILNALRYARSQQWLNGPVNLVYFDYHDDAHPPIAPEPLRIQYANNLPGEEEFWQFVEWRLSTDDGDWLKTGMDVGLIQDALLIGGVSMDNIVGANTYQDVNHVDHHIRSVPHIWEGLDANGRLVDGAQAAALQPIRDMIGWGLHNGHAGFLTERDDVPPFVLDFDLDCFTTLGAIGHIPWPDYRYNELVTRTFDHGVVPESYKPVDFFQRLSSFAEFITIARETPYCGGYRGSEQILQWLDLLLFRGRLCLVTSTRRWFTLPG
jgi:hypothetical protein